MHPLTYCLGAVRGTPYNGGGKMSKAISRWNGNFINSFFDDFFQGIGYEWRMPLVDIKEKEDSYVVKAEIPGVDREDIDITRAHNGIYLKVEKTSESEIEEKEGEGMYSYERDYRGFYRYIPMPEDADTEKIDAKYNKGILEIVVPKDKSKESKRIEVK